MSVWWILAVAILVGMQAPQATQLTGDAKVEPALVNALARESEATYLVYLTERADRAVGRVEHREGARPRDVGERLSGPGHRRRQRRHRRAVQSSRAGEPVPREPRRRRLQPRLQLVRSAALVRPRRHGAMRHRR